MPENNTLHIHTRLIPDAEPPVSTEAPKKRKRHRQGITHPRTAPKKLAPGDRLLRNSAVACAILLGILALGNMRQPWAEKAAGSIERALTMRIDLDDSIGELTFVRQIMPESALDF